MNKEIYLKVLFHLSLLGVLTSLLAGFYDVIFGFIFEAIHLLFEVVEMTLDKMIEHAFETELHETQLIVFYILIAIGGVLLYWFFKFLKYIGNLFGHGVINDWLSFKTAITEDWRAMPMSSRVLWIGMFLLVNYLISFFLF